VSSCGRPGGICNRLASISVEPLFFACGLQTGRRRIFFPRGFSPHPTIVQPCRFRSGVRGVDSSVDLAGMTRARGPGSTSCCDLAVPAGRRPRHCRRARCENPCWRSKTRPPEAYGRPGPRRSPASGPRCGYRTLCWCRSWSATSLRRCCRPWRPPLSGAASTARSTCATCRRPQPRQTALTSWSAACVSVVSGWDDTPVLFVCGRPMPTHMRRSSRSLNAGAGGASTGHRGR
jgi:hypothetical protein